MISSLKTNVDTKQPLKVCLKSSTKNIGTMLKLISGVLRWRMPIDRVIKLVDSLQLDSENINTWKNGVERALKKNM